MGCHIRARTERLVSFFIIFEMLTGRLVIAKEGNPFVLAK